MKKRILIFLIVVITAFVAVACTFKIDGISQAGSNLYFDTRSNILKIVNFDLCKISAGDYHGDNYEMDKGEYYGESILFRYFLDSPSNVDSSKHFISVLVDKSYNDEEWLEAQVTNRYLGLITNQDKAKEFLGNIICSYTINYVDMRMPQDYNPKNENYTNIRLRVSICKDVSIMEQGLQNSDFKEIEETFGAVAYGNELISYYLLSSRPSMTYDEDPPLKEPTAKIIKEMNNVIKKMNKIMKSESK